MNLSQRNMGLGRAIGESEKLKCELDADVFNEVKSGHRSDREHDVEVSASQGHKF